MAQRPPSGLRRSRWTALPMLHLGRWSTGPALLRQSANGPRCRETGSLVRGRPRARRAPLPGLVDRRTTERRFRRQRPPWVPPRARLSPGRRLPSAAQERSPVSRPAWPGESVLPPPAPPWIRSVRSRPVPPAAGVVREARLEPPAAGAAREARPIAPVQTVPAASPTRPLGFVPPSCRTSQGSAGLATRTRKRLRWRRPSAAPATRGSSGDATRGRVLEVPRTSSSGLPPWPDSARIRRRAPRQQRGRAGSGSHPPRQRSSRHRGTRRSVPSPHLSEATVVATVRRSGRLHAWCPRRPSPLPIERSRPDSLPPSPVPSTRPRSIGPASSTTDARQSAT